MQKQTMAALATFTDYSQLEQSSDLYSISEERNINPMISRNSDIHASLSLSSANFNKFLSSLGNLALTPTREDILEYLHYRTKNQYHIQEHVPVEWLKKKIALRVEKMVRTKRLKRNWGEDDLKLLVWVVSKYSDLKNIADHQTQITLQDWKAIASIIPGVTPESCMFKWLSLKKITLSNNGWSQEQSSLLDELVKNSGQPIDWRIISQELFKRNSEETKVFRNAKLCREHWTCYLSPQLRRGPWELHEDVKLLKFIKENAGKKKWSEIAKQFEGRTQNALKNRYTLLIEKQRRSSRNRKKTQMELVIDFLEKNYVKQFTCLVRNNEVQQKANQQCDLIEIWEQKTDWQSIKSQKVEQSPSSPGPTPIAPISIQKLKLADLPHLIGSSLLQQLQPCVMRADGSIHPLPQFPSLQSNLCY